mmetsp:Transcript_37170/g.111313  ORF Transcript_37170/g.111313 Transcript_37170/m.111313 type:complete len:131 (-) Transcript_37170:693-1085(-)
MNRRKRNDMDTPAMEPMRNTRLGIIDCSRFCSLAALVVQVTFRCNEACLARRDGDGVACAPRSKSSEEDAFDVAREKAIAGLLSVRPSKSTNANLTVVAMTLATKKSTFMRLRIIRQGMVHLSEPITSGT